MTGAEAQQEPAASVYYPSSADNDRQKHHEREGRTIFDIRRNSTNRQQEGIHQVLQTENAAYGDQQQSGLFNHSFDLNRQFFYGN